MYYVSRPLSLLPLSLLLLFSFSRFRSHFRSRSRSPSRSRSRSRFLSPSPSLPPPLYRCIHHIYIQLSHRHQYWRKIKYVYCSSAINVLIWFRLMRLYDASNCAHKKPIHLTTEHFNWLQPRISPQWYVEFIMAHNHRENCSNVRIAII